MITGILSWFVDADKKTTLEQKLSVCATVYQQRRVNRPSVVYMHPETAGEAIEVAGMAVKRDATVQRDHFYLGEE